MENPEKKNWNYYEVDFFRYWPKSGKRPAPYCAENAIEKEDADYSMLIKAYHKPTIEEAELWLNDDIVKLNEAGVLQVVGPVTEEEVAESYDMSNKDEWPIFG